MERLGWIDSLRGLACFIVSFNHYIMGEMEAPYRSFWALPADQNRRWFQLPPIRFLFAVHAVVPLFMVLGGYCISVPLIRLRESETGLLLRRTQSAIVRRFLRLYLPVFFISFFSQILYFTDSYNWPWFPAKVLRGLKPWSCPSSHIIYLIRYMADLTDILHFQFQENFNNQIWTVPLELRGSLVVYFAVLVLCFWRLRLRIGATILLMANLLWYCHWETFCFVGGMFLAEVNLFQKLHCPQQQQQHQQRQSSGHYSPQGVKMRNLLLLTIGLYLMYFDGENSLPPGYQWIASIQSPHWTSFAQWTDIRYCLHSIGGLLLVGAIARDPGLQRPLAANNSLQYLGRISFSLFLVHVMVFRVLRNPLLDSIWWLGTGMEYGWADKAYSQSPVAFWVTWWVSGTIIGLITLGCAQAFDLIVDKKCVKWSRMLDDWLVGDSPTCPLVQSPLLKAS